MDLRSVLNTILIGLTLSTIILTLIIYFIFKLKQGVVKKTNKDKHFLEGAYFKRISPKLELENEIARKSFEKDLQKKEKKYRIRPWMSYALVFISIVIFLVIDKRYAYKNFVKSKLQDKSTTEELSKLGLMKEYEFQPDLPQDFLRYNKYYINEKTHNLFEKLRSAKIAIYKNELTKLSEYRVWLSYLKSIGANVLESGLKDTLTDAKILIIPSTAQLNKLEVDQIRLAHLNGASLIIVGPAGQAYSLEEHSNYLLTKLGFESKLQCNPIQSSNLDSINIKPTKQYKIPFNLPANASLNFKKASNCKFKEASLDSTILYQLQDNMSNHVLTMYSTDRNPITVINVIPRMADEYGSLEDLFWGQLFYFSIQPQQIQFVDNPNQSDFTLSLAVVGDEDYAASSLLKAKLSDAKLPFTFFVTSSVYDENYPALFPATDEIEIASQGLQSRDLTKLNLVEIFHQVQEARLTTEMLSKKKISGFRFPFDKFSWEILTSVYQNKYLYILGTEDFSWREPVPLAADFYYIPSSDLNIKTILNRRDVANVDDFYQHFTKVIQKAMGDHSNLVVRVDPSWVLNEPQIVYFTRLIEELKNNFPDNVVTLDKMLAFKTNVQKIHTTKNSDNSFLIENESDQDFNKILFWSTIPFETHNGITLKDKKNLYWQYELETFNKKTAITLVPKNN